jgi:hypothetical protein
MSSFGLTTLRNNSVWALYRLRGKLDINPDYQRESDIWNSDKKQLLVDTILNRFDVPKIYLHKFPTPIEKNNITYEYAVIDGKQRLTTLWGFIDNQFSLSDDFDYLGDPSVTAKGMKYADLAKSYPEIKQDFDAFSLDVVVIETDDIEIIEDLFSRLNEAVPLNAAEKRNALPGAFPRAIRKLAQHALFSSKLPFSNTRYRHYDLIAKMLMSEYRDAVVDTKKAYLDRFFRDTAKIKQVDADVVIQRLERHLDAMAQVFVVNDSLLQSVGMVMLYYHLFRIGIPNGLHTLIDRAKLLAFNKQRAENKELAQADIAKASYDLIEFDRFSQSPNDGIAMRFRLRVVNEKVFGSAFPVVDTSTD